MHAHTRARADMYMHVCMHAHERMSVRLGVCVCVAYYPPISLSPPPRTPHRPLLNKPSQQRACDSRPMVSWQTKVAQ